MARKTAGAQKPQPTLAPTPAPTPVPEPTPAPAAAEAPAGEQSTAPEVPASPPAAPDPVDAAPPAIEEPAPIQTEAAAVPAPAADEPVPDLDDFIAAHEKAAQAVDLVVTAISHPAAKPGHRIGVYSGFPIAAGPLQATYSDGSMHP